MKPSTVNKLRDLFVSNPQLALKKCLQLTAKKEYSCASDRMEEINKIILGYGVEAIYSHNYEYGYWGNIVAEYINFGDIYLPTIIMTVKGGSRFSAFFRVGNIGDWIEKNNKKLQII